MPWEIRILAAKKDTPIGTKEAVRKWLAATLPGAKLRLPPGPPDEFYEQFAPETAAEMKNDRNLEALYEDDDFTIEFYCSNLPEIRCLHADVRGNGNPLPVLAKLCLPKGWTVVSSADLTQVDLTATSASQWDGFRQFRDQAIVEIEDEAE